MIPEHKVSGSCTGEKCTMCGDPATHKVGEEFLYDPEDTVKIGPMFEVAVSGHNMTAYVCCRHFNMIVGGRCRVKDVQAPDDTNFWIATTLDLIKELSEGKILLVNNDFKIGMSDDMTIGYMMESKEPGGAPTIGTFDPVPLHILHSWNKKFVITVVTDDDNDDDVE